MLDKIGAWLFQLWFPNSYETVLLLGHRNVGLDTFMATSLRAVCFFLVLQLWLRVLNNLKILALR